MNWKHIFFIAFGFFIFGLGFWSGGLSWGLSHSGHESEVAFWAMVGGWVSGLATLAAVVVSMVLAYQGTQAGIENLTVSFNHIYHTSTTNKNKKITVYDTANIKVTNLRNVTATITDILMEIDGVNLPLSVGFIKQGGKGLPYTFTRVGETFEFAFSISGSTRLDLVLLFLKKDGIPTFQKGYFIIQTSIKQYKLKMDKDLLAALHERFKVVEQREIQ